MVKGTDVTEHLFISNSTPYFHLFSTVLYHVKLNSQQNFNKEYSYYSIKSKINTIHQGFAEVFLHRKCFEAVINKYG